MTSAPPTASTTGSTTTTRLARRSVVLEAGAGRDSLHPSGCQVTMGDGAVRFIRRISRWFVRDAMMEDLTKMESWWIRLNEGTFVCGCISLGSAFRLAGCTRVPSGRRRAVEGVVTLDGKPLAGQKCNSSRRARPGPDGLWQDRRGWQIRHLHQPTASNGRRPRRLQGRRQQACQTGRQRLMYPSPNEDPNVTGGFKELLPAVYSDPEQTKLKATVPTESAEGFDLQAQQRRRGS